MTDDQFVTRALYDGALAAGIAHAERAIAAEARVAELGRKYETPGVRCGNGHENNLPVSLWTCPRCHDAVVAERDSEREDHSAQITAINAGLDRMREREAELTAELYGDPEARIGGWKERAIAAEAERNALAARVAKLETDVRRHYDNATRMGKKADAAEAALAIAQAERDALAARVAELEKPLTDEQVGNIVKLANHGIEDTIARAAIQSLAAQLATAHGLQARAERAEAALRCFLDDPRFQVAVGGNPIVVQKMIATARAALAAVPS